MAQRGKVHAMFAAVFPGQGSQKPGMGKELHSEFSEAREVFRAVKKATGVNTETLCFETDEESLRQTQNAQLALFTVGVAAWNCLRSKLDESVTPSAMAGHSVGEYAALVCASVLSLEEGSRLVKRRGELMALVGQQRPGTMAAILGMDRQSLDALCAEVSTGASIVVVANDNCPGQLVVSGDSDAIKRLIEIASERGAKRVIPLNVSGGFHSPLMAGAAQQLGLELHETVFSGEPGTTPVYSNVTSEPVDLGNAWPVILETQLKLPVRWSETIRNMRHEGVDTFVECGVGEVLGGLIRRIDSEARVLKANDPASIAESVAAISAAGVSA